MKNANIARKRGEIEMTIRGATSIPPTLGAAHVTQSGRIRQFLARLKIPRSRMLFHPGGSYKYGVSRRYLANVSFEIIYF